MGIVNQSVVEDTARVSNRCNSICHIFYVGILQTGRRRMNSQIKATEGQNVRFKIGQQDFIGYVELVDVNNDYLVMLVENKSGNETKITLRLEAIDAILQFVN